MTRCSNSLIREMQIKITGDIIVSHQNGQNEKRWEIPRVNETVERLELSDVADQSVNRCQHFEKLL